MLRLEGPQLEREPDCWGTSCPPAEQDRSGELQTWGQAVTGRELLTIEEKTSTTGRYMKAFVVFMALLPCCPEIRRRCGHPLPLCIPKKHNLVN